MDRIREPSELILDENDDHLIFEIPTDPNDGQTRQQQRNRDAREKAEGNTSVSPTKGGKVLHKVCLCSSLITLVPIIFRMLEDVSHEKYSRVVVF